MFFSHGSEHSRGVLILIKNSLKFQLISVRSDIEGRFIFLEAFVQDLIFKVLICKHLRSKTSEQTLFYQM